MWTDKWIGLPYRVLGRGPDAYDCLGLMMAVQAEQFGVHLDYGLVNIGQEECDAKARYLPAWARVDEPREGDVVLMRRGRGWHVGIALDGEWMLHADAPASSITNYRRSMWGRRLEGIYRHVG